MPIETHRYIRKPLYVDAVRVTSANFVDISEWCQGSIEDSEVPGEGTGKQYIKVRVHNPKHPRQTKAFIGDWILYTERGYKVYTNKAFRASFDLASEVEPGTLSHTTLTGDPVVDADAEHRAVQRSLLKNEFGVNGDRREKLGPIIEGKRVLSVQEQRELTEDEVRKLLQSGEVILAQDIAHPSSKA